MHRLAHLVGGDWVAHSHPPVFVSGDRVVAGVPEGNPALLGQLVECMEPPYHLLYVLHTSRGEAEAGRYQSPPLAFSEISEFLERFALFLAGDGRFDLWVHSPHSQGTLVWDRHNQLFGYGPVQRFSSKLADLGFIEGYPAVPAPHQHHYREELDHFAEGVMQAFDWVYSPLRPEDEQ